MILRKKIQSIKAEASQSEVHCFASVISAIAPAAFASGQSLLCSAQQKQALFTAASACSTFSSDTDFPV